MTPWTVARQAPLSMGFSRQEYWSGLPFPSPGALPDPGIEPGSLTLQAESLASEPPGKLNVDKMGPAFPIKGAIACSTLYSTPAQGWPGAGLRNKMQDDASTDSSFGQPSFLCCPPKCPLLQEAYKNLLFHFILIFTPPPFSPNSSLFMNSTIIFHFPSVAPLQFPATS